MNPNVKRLHESLITAKSGQLACNAVDGLAKLAKKGDGEAKASLAQYMIAGRIDHVRDFACSSLAELVDHSDKELAPRFEEGLEDDAIQYWCVLGYARTRGRKAYGKLTNIALDKSLSAEVRAQAVKCLSSSSGQPFDRKLPVDPGEWEESDIRGDEIAAWSKAGYPSGTGHPSPVRHPALDRPESGLERAASRLDKRLAKQRRNEQDPADPTNWLVVAEAESLDEITSRWKLPSLYLDFLTRFSPMKVTLEDKRFSNGGLELFGAGELINAQEGYAYNPVKRKAIRGWPKGYVVIAAHGGDPYVLDLSSSNGHEAPVLTAEHGTGSWDFEPYADSFEQFLKSLANT